MSLFNPNTTCVIIKKSGYNVYGEPEYNSRVTERCTLINADTLSKKSSVRADSSASRGNAQETVADFWLILMSNTVAEIDDLVEIKDLRVKINELAPRYDLIGRHDHTEALCTMWNEVEE